MAGVSERTREGSRKRSLSESDTDKISGLTFGPSSPTNLNPDCNIENDTSFHNSNPELYSPEDLYIETPVGGGEGYPTST